MLTHTCVSSDIDRKPSNYSFVIPCETDHKNDKFEKFLFRFFMEYYLKCEKLLMTERSRDVFLSEICNTVIRLKFDLFLIHELASGFVLFLTRRIDPFIVPSAMLE